MVVQKWGQLAPPVDPRTSVDIYKVMSSMTKNGKVPSWEEAEAEYERRGREEINHG